MKKESLSSTDSSNRITLVGERQAGPAFADSGFIRLLATVPPRGSSSLLLTYALGLHPLDRFEKAFTISRSGNRLYALYRRIRPELVYAVQQSSDGINWSSEDVDQGPPGAIGVASIPIQANASMLLRLEVRER